MRYTLFTLFFVLSLSSLFSKNPPPVDCDTVLVVAQATAGNLTCIQPSVELTGGIHPTALSYAWTGPLGFTSNKRVAMTDKTGAYVLTVTGPYGCTAQTSVVVKDDCSFYPLVPPACPGANAYYPPAESCPEACVRPFIPKKYKYSTAGYQNSGTPPGGFCSEIKNDQWWAFVAGSQSGKITAIPSNCANGNGIQMALYPACGAAPVACNPGATGFGTTPISISPNGLIIGKVYYLMVNGYEGDLCDFEFDYTSGICDSTTLHPSTPSISGQTKVCPGASVPYSFFTPPGATAYLWTGPPGSSINGQPSPAVLYVPASNGVNVTFGTESGFVSVRALYYFSPPSDPISIQVLVEPLPKTIFPNVSLCEEELPYTLPWGALATKSGTYTDTLTSYLGCDSILQQKVFAQPPIITNIGTKYVCAGNSIEVCGNVLSTTGPFYEVCTSFLGCDSLVTGQLVVLDPIAKIGGGGTLNCLLTSITLTSEPSAGIKFWSGSGTGSGDYLIVTQPGIYILTTILVAGGVTCIKRDTTFVSMDVMPPLISPKGGTITCSVPNPVLQSGASNPTVTFFWTGPNGFSSTLSKPSVSLPGIYTLIATGSNGCTNSGTVTVVTDLAVPGASTSGGEITPCGQTSIQLNGNSPTSSATLLWTGPGGFSSTLSNPAVSLPGLYTLVATGPNGCTSTATTIVIASQAVPGASASGGGILTCNLTSIQLNGSSPTPSTTLLWTGPGGFSSTLSNPAVSLPGLYTLVATGPNGCTSTATTIVTADQAVPGASASGGTLTCNSTSIALTGDSPDPSASLLWTGPGGFSSSQPNPSISAAGEYTLTATAANGCQSTAKAFVTADQVLPTVSINDATLNCAAPSTVLEVNADMPLVAYTWSGPNGFSSDQPNTSVSAAGEYTLTATAANGCQSTAKAFVTADQVLPTVSINDATLNCATPSTVLEVNTDMPLVAYAWSGPNGFSSDQPNASVSAAGEYTLIATAANGCQSTAKVFVTADQISPTVSINDATLHCTAPSTILEVNTDMPLVAYAWSGPNGFSSTQPNASVSAAGEYTLTATATNGCTGSATASVLAPPPYTSFLMEIFPPVCSNQSNGALWASIGGGAMPYNFLWSSGATVSNISGLSAGVYGLTVTDQNGCATSTSVALVAVDNQPPTVTAQDAILNLDLNGSALVTLATINAQVGDNCGGVTATIAPSSFDCDQKGPQTVTVTATDQAGLTATAIVTVTIVDDGTPMLTCPASIRACFSDHIVLYQEPTISDNCSLDGGLPSQIQGLPSGAAFPAGVTTQTYTFTDASGNTGTCSFDVTVVPPLVFEKTEVTHTSSGQSNGAIDLTISGNTAPYLFAWTMNGQPVGDTEDLTGLPAGAYRVQVTDAEGCTYVLEGIEVKSASSSTSPVQVLDIRVTPNPMADEARIEVLGARDLLGDFRLQVFDLQGKVVRDLPASTPVFVLKKESLPAGMYLFRVLVEDSVVGSGKLVVTE